MYVGYLHHIGYMFGTKICSIHNASSAPICSTRKYVKQTIPYSLSLFEFITLVPNTHFGAEYILLPNIWVTKFINLVSDLHFGAEHRRYASKFLANGHWRMATIGSSKMVNGHWPFAENWSQNRRMATPIFVAIHFKTGHSFEMAIRLTGPISKYP